MSQIAIVITNDGGQRTKLLSLVRETTGSAFSVIARAIQNRQPVFERRLFYRDHDDVAAALRKLISGLSNLGAEFEIYELPESQAYATSDPADLRHISRKVLENILVAHEEGLQEQQEAVDQELSDAESPSRPN